MGADLDGKGRSQGRIFRESDYAQSRRMKVSQGER